ncbi:MAG TPA: clostripain-related cysteine peptidase, partial [Anaerolineales bacterium]|nr:clostripain-related cysteine peptidase [Anaerolineales bacterium]
DADDKVLEQDIYIDLNEAEKVGSTENVKIVAQTDRFSGGFTGDGDWTSTKRFLVTQDNDLKTVSSQQITDLGEVNMASGDSLVDFVAWVVQNYPADKYALILSDHGMGWPGGWSDPTSTEGGDPRIPLSSALGDELYLMELDEALTRVREQAGIDQFELIGMDACLMSHLEVYSALQPHARFAVASQETEPSLGWAYSSFLSELAANPNMDGGTLGNFIVESYIVDDQRIVDDQARAEFLRPSSPFGGSFSAAQITNQLTRDITITTVDLAALPVLIDSVNDFAFTLQNVDQSAVAQSRSYAQSFTNIFGSQVPPSYIDLGHFVQLVARATGDSQISQLAQQVMDSLSQTVIAEKHGSNKSGATGISIYFPNSTLYSSPITGAQSYVQVSNRFARETIWDDFLAYHYIGRSFQPAQDTQVIPEASDRVTPPGAEGGIILSPITASSSIAAPGSPILLSTEVTGKNIGFIKLFVGLHDPNANSIYVADTDYLESAQSQELNGVYYPVWDEDGNFNLEFEWEPVVFAINDGSNSAIALFTPESYGKAVEDAVYTVEALYTFADGSGQRRARLYFRDGMLRQVFGFTGEQATGAPREITPEAGDQITIIEQWMDLDENGRVTGTVEENGETLTFGNQMFTWETLDAPVGNYVVGFIAEDLDGNEYEVYTNVSVQ